jgi:hypothetical protein
MSRRNFGGSSCPCTPPFPTTGVRQEDDSERPKQRPRRGRGQIPPLRSFDGGSRFLPPAKSIRGTLKGFPNAVRYLETGARASRDCGRRESEGKGRTLSMPNTELLQNSRDLRYYWRASICSRVVLAPLRPGSLFSYRSAVKRWPRERIILRQGARVVVMKTWTE